MAGLAVTMAEHPTDPDLLRLLGRCEPLASGCWRWTGALSHNGYGLASIGGRTVRVHREVYTRVVGPIPDGQDLDHLCRVRSCCRPAHLAPCSPEHNRRVGQRDATLARHAVTPRRRRDPPPSQMALDV